VKKREKNNRLNYLRDRQPQNLDANSIDLINITHVICVKNLYINFPEGASLRNE